MYLKYFKLKEQPFADTPDPRFLYRSPGHQEALERLIAAVNLRRGICAIVAEPGLGKSTIIRTLLTGFKSTVNFAWVFNTAMNAAELLRFICRDFGFSPSSGDKSDLLIELYTFFVRERKDGRIPLLVIDEAQNLKPETLEEIRLLSNFETSEQKLLQIILSGQPQLDAYLDLPEMAQLRQRITFKATLSRFCLEDTAGYIRHRMEVAGGSSEWFTPGAVEKIHQLSGGIPRLINQICDNALMAAASRRLPRIDAALIHELLEKGAVVQAPPPPKIVAPSSAPVYGPKCGIEERPKVEGPNRELSMPRLPRAARPQSHTAVPTDRSRRIIFDKDDLFEAVDLTELISVL